MVPAKKWFSKDDEEPELWSEYNPILYQFEWMLGAKEQGQEIDCLVVETGLRKCETRGCFFCININGNRTMLRGKHDGMLFTY